MEILFIPLFFPIRTVKKRDGLVFWGLLILPLLLCGCWPGADLIGAYEKDISDRKELWGGYAQGQRYILLHDIFLQKDQPETYKSDNRMYAGVPPRVLTRNVNSLVYGPPNSIEVYMGSPEQWPSIIGILEAGTEIECTKIIGWGTLMWPMSHTVYAIVKNGQHAGKSIDIQDLSFTSWDKRGSKENYVLYPNPGLLKKLEN